MQAAHAVCPSASWKLPAAHLEQMDAPIVALCRGDIILAVGKFTPDTIKKISQPGDQVLTENGMVGTYRPTETPSSSSSEPAPPAPQVPFQGTAHKL